MTELADQRDTEQTIYQPAEDTHLLTSTAVEQLSAEHRVVDVGTGSGYVGATIAEETGATVVGTDLNPHACRQAKTRGIDTIRADLVTPIATASVDVVVCNPPYLPTNPDDARNDWMEVALSGGESGLAVIEPLLDTVGRVLVEGGFVLLLVSTLTGVDAVVSLADEAGFSAVVLDEESFPFETLSVLKLVR